LLTLPELRAREHSDEPATRVSVAAKGLWRDRVKDATPADLPPNIPAEIGLGEHPSK
jgi:hypothetical protein